MSRFGFIWSEPQLATMEGEDKAQRITTIITIVFIIFIITG